MPMCGGLGEKKPATPEVQALCDLVKAEFFSKSGLNSNHYQAFEYKTQLVAGTNYFVKICLDDETFTHLRIYKTLPHAGETVTLTSFQLDKSKEEDIVHF